MKRYINSYKHLENWFGFWKFYYEAKKTKEDQKFYNGFLRSGLAVVIPSSLISAFDEVFLREIYKSNILNLTKNPLIIDIGANVGYFSLYIFSLFPLAKIFAFEPLPTNFKLLEQHKQLNKLFGLVLDKRAVLGDKNFVEINYNSSDNFSVGASFLVRSNSNSTINVPAISIPEIFKEYSIDQCDLLKIDCEGAEYNILFHCPAEYFNKIKNLVIEVHGWVPETEGSISKLTSYLIEQNYSVENFKNEIIWCTKP